MRRSTSTLTARQAEILRFIIAHVNEFGYAPSGDDVREFMGAAALNGAHEVIRVLARKGYLTFDPELGRSIVPVRDERGLRLKRVPRLEIKDVYISPVCAGYNIHRSRNPNMSKEKSDKPLRIVALEASNVKRIKAVSIKPTGDLVIIGGRNGQGKSSVLDSITYALAGGKEICGRPLRDGETDGEVSLDLGTMTVTRTFGEGGKTSLKVVSAEGQKFASPQVMLDSLVGKLSFDPLALLRLDGKKQSEMLRGLVGLDFTKLDAKRATAYDKRRDIGVTVKTLKGSLATTPKPADAPSAPVDVQAILSRYQAAVRVTEEYERMARDLAALDAQILSLTKQRDELKARYADRDEPEDVAELKAKLDSAQADGEKFRQAKAHDDLKAKLKATEAEYEAQTKIIDDVDAEKAKALESAKFPVKGLSFTDDGLSLNGLPFDQASQAERLKAAVAMGIASNPAIRVILIRDGSLLDADSMRDVAELAHAHDAQVWVERVGTEAGMTVVIEDGHVA